MKTLKHAIEEKLQKPLNTLCVSDLMSEDLFTLNVDDNFVVAEEIMKWRAIRHIPVVDLENRLVGLVTHRDILKTSISSLVEISKLKVQEIYKNIRVGDIMCKEVVYVFPDTLLMEAAAVMVDKKYGCLPVVCDQRLVGIITEADFVYYFGALMTLDLHDKTRSFS